MGWCGYSIYSGDGTQTCHYNFIKWAGVKVSDDDIMDNNWLGMKTKISKEHLNVFIRGLPKVIKKMPKAKFWNEDKAIEWQMLLALCMDNKIQPPEIIYRKGIEATEFLMEDHASDFDRPSVRRSYLRQFKRRAEKVGYVADDTI